MQRAQSDDGSRHAGLRSNPLIPTRRRDTAAKPFHAPKRLSRILTWHHEDDLERDQITSLRNPTLKKGRVIAFH